ncbi:MAG: hypothetical protein IJD11_03455 [Oscillospiraceae bacterium]|nr:hypothetical protein [Oscillospiraceae bacterium]
MFFLPKLELLQNTVKTEGKYRGLDFRPVAAENTLSDCAGISASALPTLSVCNPKSVAFSTADTVYDILDAGNEQMLEVFGGSPTRILRHYALQDGTKITRNILLSVGDSFVSAACFYADLIVLVRNGEKLLLYRYDQICERTETVDVSDFLDTQAGGTLRLMSFLDRMIILQNEMIHISYIRSLNQWNEDFPEEPLEIPFSAQHSRIPGKQFSCGILYRSRPVVFDTNEMYQIYNDLTPFSIVKTADVGCINPRSVAICNGVLCFLSADGVMAYNGTGLPYKISEQLPDISIAAQNSGACALGNCYYLGEYVYSFDTKEWTKLHSLPSSGMITAAYSDSEKALLLEKTETRSTLYQYIPGRCDAELSPTPWSFTTQEFHEQEPGKKKLTQLAFRVEPMQNVELKVEISVEGGEWQTLCERSLSQNGAEEIRVKTPPSENFRLRFSGTGKLSIGYIRRVYRLLSDGKIHPFL